MRLPGSDLFAAYQSHDAVFQFTGISDRETGGAVPIQQLRISALVYISSGRDVRVLGSKGLSVSSFRFMRLRSKISRHPLAKALIAQNAGQSIPEVTDFTVFAGNGLSAVLDGEILEGGSFRYISQKYSIPAELEARARELSDAGKTPLLFTKGGRLIGMILQCISH